VFDGNFLIFIISLGWFMQCYQHNCTWSYWMRGAQESSGAPYLNMKCRERRKVKWNLILWELWISFRSFASVFDYAQWFNLGVTHSGQINKNTVYLRCVWMCYYSCMHVAGTWKASSGSCDKCRKDISNC